jgi:protein-disulfide isomerase
MSTTIKDPGIVYAASIQHENALGDPAAPVTLDVYSDFQCPICANYSLNVEPALVAKYVMPGKLRIVHHDLEWIAQSGDRESRIAAAGGVCAARAEQYWTYGHWVFANQLGENVGSFKQDRLLKIAAAAGMDSASLASCMGASDVLAQVDANTAQFVPIVKANQGTPTILLNGVAIASHTVVDLSRAIESALAGPAASPSGSVVP